MIIIDIGLYDNVSGTRNKILSQSGYKFVDVFLLLQIVLETGLGVHAHAFAKVTFYQVLA